MAPSKLHRAKGSAKTTPAPSSSSSTGPAPPPPPPPTFPIISQKYLKDLKVETLLEDQIVVVHDVLRPKECKTFLDFFGNLEMTPSPPKKRGEAERSNGRFSTLSPTFASHLFTTTSLSSLVSSWPSVVSPSTLTVQGLHPNIRVYRYTPGQLFGPHYDSPQLSPDPATPKHASEWTLLIYLTEEEVEGGETVFHLRGKKGGKVVVRPKSGMALLHRHGSGRECLIHEGRKVEKGVKWVLRSDLMFG